MGRLPVIWQTLDISVNPLGKARSRGAASRPGLGERPEKISARPAAIKRAAALACLAWAGAAAAAVTLDEARRLHQEGRLEEAVAAYREVAESDTDPADVATAHNNACVVLMDLGDYPAALAECDAAWRLRAPMQDKRGLARTLNNRGLALQRLGRHAEAEAAYRDALALNRARGDAEGEAVNLRNLALLASIEGRYSLAREQLAQVMRLAAAHADERWADVERRLATLNLGVMLEKLGAYEEALGRYRELLAEEDALEPRHRAALRINVGVVYRNLGDPVRALEAFRSGVAAYEELGDTASLANAWGNIGLVHHLELRDFATAEQSYRQALDLALRSGDREEETWARIDLGRLLLDDGRLDEAEESLETALRVATESDSAEGRWTALDGLARIALARGDDASGLALLLQAIDVIETVRRDVRGADWRAQFFADKRGVYGTAVAVLARLDATDPGAEHAARALALVQRAKARELIEALGPRAQPAVPLDAPGLQASVGTDVVIEYFLAEGRLYRWTIRRDALELRDLGEARPVLDAVSGLHDALAHGQPPPGEATDLLSRTLLAELELPAEAALYVAPDGALQYLPFELLAPEPGEPPLVERATLSYLPSASALAWLRASAVQSDLKLLAFGDVPPITETDPALATTLALDAFQLAPLAESLAEIEAARRYLKGRQEVLTGRSASEAAFRARAGQAAAVVHIASHTLVDERPGRGAAILLAPSEHADGLLRPDEIVSQRHPAALTVLAACRSAAGVLAGGAALRSLTGAFLASGSRAVLATLWDVDDRTTAAFMEQLYYEIGRGVPPVEALRSVKMRLAATPEWRNPSTWAGYVLIGEATLPVAGTHRGPRPLATGAGGVAIALLLLLLVARRRRRATAAA
jgi:tetratricopeptide (TPR) repeat protein